VSVILFDGVCNLCNAGVRFVIERDPAKRFRFAALQSDAAATILRQVQRGGELPDSVVLVENDRLYVRSTAALRVARRLRFPWSLAWGFIVVPRPLRDWVYDVVARKRYGWFGKRDACMVPTPELRERFLP
jgi:predicted DCC family thiol-disulfide oxidoreductase YuxK